MKKLLGIIILGLLCCNVGFASEAGGEREPGTDQKCFELFEKKKIFEKEFLPRIKKDKGILVTYIGCDKYYYNWGWWNTLNSDIIVAHEIAYSECALKQKRKYNLTGCHLFSIDDVIVWGKDAAFVAKVEKDIKTRLVKINNKKKTELKPFKYTPIVSEHLASKKNTSGFMLYNYPNPNNLAPISRTYKGKTPNISLINGTDLKIIIWSHGTDRPQKREKCYKWSNPIPNTLLILNEINNTYFYFLCSRAVDGATVGSYIYKRKKEINKVLDQLISAGVKPENIFLAGQSAGGWTSLMMMDQVEKKFNSAIVFAPAFAGPRSETSRFPKWRMLERPRQVKKMTKVKAVKALIFAYEDDAFNRPQELIFLKEKYPNSVKLVSYNCGNGHGTGYNDCRGDTTKMIIINYFKNQK